MKGTAQSGVCRRRVVGKRAVGDDSILCGGELTRISRCVVREDALVDEGRVRTRCVVDEDDSVDAAARRQSAVISFRLSGRSSVVHCLVITVGKLIGTDADEGNGDDRCHGQTNGESESHSLQYGGRASTPQSKAGHVAS